MKRVLIVLIVFICLPLLSHGKDISVLAVESIDENFDKMEGYTPGITALHFNQSIFPKNLISCYLPYLQEPIYHKLSGIFTEINGEQIQIESKELQYFVLTPFGRKEFNSNDVEYYNALKIIDKESFSDGYNMLLSLHHKMLKDEHENFMTLWLYWKLSHLLAEDDNNVEQGLKTVIKSYNTKIKDKLSIPCFNQWIAELYRKSDNIKYAKLHFEYAAEEFKNLGLFIDQAFCINKIGVTYFGTGDIDNAEKYFNEALKIRERELPFSLPVAASLNNLGIVYRMRGELKEAEKLMFKSLEIRRKIAPDSLLVAKNYNSLGNLALTTGDLEKAEKYHKNALSIREKSGKRSLALAESFNNLAMVAMEKGNIDLALSYLVQDEQITEKLSPGSLSLALTKNNIGLIFQEQGNYYSAKMLFLQSLKLREQSAPNSLELADSYHNLGIFEYLQGKFEIAYDYNQKALKIREELAPDSLDYSASLTSIGNIELARGNIDKAKLYHMRALEIDRKNAPNSMTLATSLSSLGEVYAAQGCSSCAEEYYREAIDIEREIAPSSLNIAATLTNLGVQLAEGKNYDKALKLLSEALELERKLSPESLLYASTIGAVAKCRLLKGEIDKAEKDCIAGLEIENLLAPYTVRQAETLSIYADIQEAKGNLTEALQYYLKAVEALEKQMLMLGGSKETEANFRSRVANIYRSLISLQQKVGKNKEAFNSLENFRAKNLLRMFAERELNFRSTSHQEPIKKQRNINYKYGTLLRKLSKLNPEKDSEELVAITEEMEALTKEAEKCKKIIRGHAPTMGKLQYPEPLSFEEATEFFDDNTLFLSYCVTKEDILIFGLLGDKLKVQVVKSKSKIISQYISGLRAFHTSSNLIYGNVDSQSYKLYDYLISPFSKMVKNADRIVICPDKFLNYLPFEALKDAKSRYLIEKKPVSYAVSATVLSELKNPRYDTVKYDIVGFGNPDYSGYEVPLELLPGSEKELKEISHYAGERKCKMFTGKEATETVAFDNAYSGFFLHFACHGLTDERYPLNSALALAADDKNDGLLHAWEIIEKPYFSVRLLTLSGCNTSLGKNLDSEGMIGLTRSFHYSGTPSIISTLWSIDDDASAELTRLIYFFISKGYNYSESLQKAKIVFIKGKEGINRKYCHPFFWAGYILNGHWKQ